MARYEVALALGVNFIAILAVERLTPDNAIPISICNTTRSAVVYARLSGYVANVQPNIQNTNNVPHIPSTVLLLYLSVFLPHRLSENAFTNWLIRVIATTNI